MTDEVRTHYGDDTPLDARWYVVHTYSGYENKVKEDLEKTIENRNLQDLILEVKYPTEQVTEPVCSGEAVFYRGAVFGIYPAVAL